MQKLFLFLLLVMALPLSAQLVTTDPAAPTDEQALTITFDATQGTGGLADCGCDVYVHTGIRNSSSSEWQFVATEWGERNAEWRMTRVEGETNLYTYTYGPSIREYFDVPDGTDIDEVSLVFRNGDGTLEGKASGGRDIFIAVSASDGALGITVAGDPEQEFWPLGRPLPVQIGATVGADLEIYDNENLVATTFGTALSTDVIFTVPGEHEVRLVATTPDGQTAEKSFIITARLEVEFTSPDNNIQRVDAGDRINLRGTSYIASTLTLSDGATDIFTGTAAELDETVTIPDNGVTTYTLTSTFAGETAVDRVSFVTSGPNVAAAPAGFGPGATRMDNGNVMLLLRAPFKDDVFVIHNFNDFAPTALTRLNKSEADGTFWIELDGLPAEGDLLYQYLIDGNLVQPDPYAELVLDPFNDRFISEGTYAGIPDYPEGRTRGIITWLRLDPPAYEWRTPPDYERPDPERMVIYELLLRDFVEAHDYATLTDTLDYLERLGVNAIELMPINEFEANLSWGYNPSFHGATDKYYGSPEDLKALVDACHERGLAVIVDIVYNHAFGQSPLVQMWFDPDAGMFGQPTPENPYFNETDRHPFGVGFDFNHESQLTKEYVKITTRRFLEEFRIDGFRWDLSKGFSQRQDGNVDQWNQYNPARIAIIEDYADHVWSINPETYMIMEHLAEAREENELSTYGEGMYFWSGFQPHDAYLEASMGYHDENKSDLSPTLAANRGFDNPRLVAYMESHDEQRMMWKNQQFGNRSGPYDIRNTPTGLDRVEATSALFYMMPGPKMLWQFGELGYDFSINYCTDGTDNEDCRTGDKPIRWDYREEQDRQDVYNWIADLNFLRNNYEFAHGQVTSENLRRPVKHFATTSVDGEMVVIGNFGITNADATGAFQSAGTYYDYATGDALEVTSTDQTIRLSAGEFHVYLTQPIEPGGGELETSTNEGQVLRLQLNSFPNPTTGELNVRFSLPTPHDVDVSLLDVNGRQIARLFRGRGVSGVNQISVDDADVPAGFYFIRLTDGLGSAVTKIIVR